MRDEFPQWIVLHVARHLPHTRPVGRGFFTAYAKNARIFCAEMPVWTEKHFSQIRKVPRFHEQPADPEQLQGFRDHLGHAGTLDHDVGPAAVRQVADDRFDD